MNLAVRAWLSFAALPAMVAGLAPALIADAWLRPCPHPFAGCGVGAVGAAVLLACMREFHVSGKGTLAPWDPPRHLVVTGLYRHVRNPMYFGVLGILAGWSVAYASRNLILYMAAIAVVFHVRVLTYEEPSLRRLFGEEWLAYRLAVRRWIPRFKPYLPPPAPSQEHPK